MDAVAHKRLPVLPGDLISFELNELRFLVVGAKPQGESRNEHPLLQRGPAPMGQRLCGLLTLPGAGGCLLREIWLDWAGYEARWYIHRARP